MAILGFPLPIWAVLLLVTIYLLYRYLTRTFDTFKALGIPGPSPKPLSGTLGLEYSMPEPDFYKFLKDTYGSIVGIFQGKMPTLVIYDLDILKKILVKDFGNFTNRRKSGQIDRMLDPPMDHLLSVISNDDWRRVRHLLTPAFTTGKLKQMANQINLCADGLVANLKEKAGETIKVEDYTGAFTLDTIASTAFGLQLNSQKELNNPFVVNSKKILQPRGLTSILQMLVPGFRTLMKAIYGPKASLYDYHASQFFLDFCDKLIKERQDKQLDQLDFLQLMMNAHKLDRSEVTEGGQEESVGATIPGSEAKSLKALSRGELVSQMVLFFLAGYQTSAVTMMYVLYNLAVHPEIQQRVQAELDDALADSEDVSPEQAARLTYLDACIHETLRMYPPAPRLERQAAADIVINGVCIPKDCYIRVPVSSIHRDPAIWEDPDTFNPARFSPEEKGKRDPLSWMPFGYGPRNCIGMRLALLEMRIALAKVLAKFSFHVCQETQIPLVMKKQSLILAPEKPIILKVGEHSE